MNALNILLISGDDADHHAVQDYTEILGWFAAITASCDEGRNKAQLQNYDAILVDSECLRAIKDIRANPGPNQGTPILLIHRSQAEDVFEPWYADVADVMVHEPLLLSTFKEKVVRLATC